MDSYKALEELSASDIGRALAGGSLNAVSLTKAALERANTGISNNIFISVSKERAMSEAVESSKRHLNGKPLSALDGVPIALKDLIDRKGEITTAGSNVYRNAEPAKLDSIIATNLTASGLISIGKVNLTEFAYSGLGLNPHFGTPHNPFSPNIPKVPGGSSSGTAVAISSNIVPCAIGTDTGGSVRIPSSFNGLVGYKSSLGRIETKGVFPLSRTLDTIGPLGRSVEDCILLDCALRGQAYTPVVARPIKGLLIYVPQNVVMDDIQSDVAQNFETSLRSMEAAGAIIKYTKIDEFEKVIELGKTYGSLAAADAYKEHLCLFENSKINQVDRRVVDRIVGGKSMTSGDVISLQVARGNLIGQMKINYCDGLIAMPTTVITAPEIEELESDDAYFHKINSLVLRNTSLGNFLDLPGLALPNGKDKYGMPSSILLSSVSGADIDLLEFGLELERVLGRS
ncbi:MAG: hypothetical protein COC00_010970 [Rhizobiales bacterium]|nr:hypothetical protein [Hyphomicrobiales bacterium]